MKINSCGICGSDLHRYLVDAYGRKFNYPLNSGHEYCAEIVETGKKVKNFKVGDQVTGDVVWKETGGAFAQYLLVPEADKRLLQINSITNSSEKMSKVDFVDLDPHHIALVEPVGIAVKAFAFGCPPGSSSNNKLAIIGSGTIGLSLLLTSIVRGFKKIVVSEPSRLRRDIAQSIGAVVVNPKASDSSDQFRRAFLAFEGDPNQARKRIENNFSVDSDPYNFDLGPFIGDIDGDELEIDFITQGTSENGIATLFEGLIVENGGTSFTYHKPDGMVFFDLILYKVKDGLSESGIYAINFNLFGRETPRNLAPIAFDQDVDMLEDISQEITLVGFDVLNDFSEQSTFEITQSPEHGQLSSNFNIVDSGNSHLIQWNILYTPDNNYYGSDEIKYSITNPDNGIPNSNEGTIVININSQNDAPVTIIEIPNLQINEDSDNSIINLSSFFGDVDGDQLGYNFNATDNSILLLEVDNEFLSITPEPNMSGGPVTVSVTVSDSELEQTQNFEIEISAIEKFINQTKNLDKEEITKGLLNSTNFYLHYQGINNFNLQKRYAKIIEKLTINVTMQGEDREFNLARSYRSVDKDTLEMTMMVGCYKEISSPMS